MISACINHGGHSEKALGLYRAMEFSGVEPSSYTFKKFMRPQTKNNNTVEAGRRGPELHVFCRKYSCEYVWAVRGNKEARGKFAFNLIECSALGLHILSKAKPRKLCICIDK